jgi:hypothetical protein
LRRPSLTNEANSKFAYILKRFLGLKRLQLEGLTIGSEGIAKEMLESLGSLTKMNELSLS